MKNGPPVESAVPAPWPVEPRSQGDRRISDALAVLHTAAALEPDHGKAMTWYCDAPIAVLDGLTAAELVARGRASAVLAFLRAAIALEVGECADRDGGGVHQSF